ncbi:hypothetical protein BS50DRAFT_620163 [Corynespora cassiicola Philippines]|uniref:Uncharacterized protein n=1 Tax=Corynespora cassiicola Philippines TaxID=1448308 RepID=A0A2T2NQC3_CORCC|nr:hypothetical protein BS50DRAFT_620163 [Corynespora cassiicola Philippines]
MVKYNKDGTLNTRHDEKLDDKARNRAASKKYTEQLDEANKLVNGGRPYQAPQPEAQLDEALEQQTEEPSGTRRSKRIINKATGAVSNQPAEQPPQQRTLKPHELERLEKMKEFITFRAQQHKIAQGIEAGYPRVQFVIEPQSFRTLYSVPTSVAEGYGHDPDQYPEIYGNHIPEFDSVGKWPFPPQGVDKAVVMRYCGAAEEQLLLNPTSKNVTLPIRWPRRHDSAKYSQGEHVAGIDAGVIEKFIVPWLLEIEEVQKHRAERERRRKRREREVHSPGRPVSRTFFGETLTWDILPKPEEVPDSEDERMGGEKKPRINAEVRRRKTVLEDIEEESDLDEDDVPENDNDLPADDGTTPRINIDKTSSLAEMIHLYNAILQLGIHMSEQRALAEKIVHEMSQRDYKDCELTLIELTIGRFYSRSVGVLDLVLNHVVAMHAQRRRDDRANPESLKDIEDNLRRGGANIDPDGSNPQYLEYSSTNAGRQDYPDDTVVVAPKLAVVGHNVKHWSGIRSDGNTATAYHGLPLNNGSDTRYIRESATEPFGARGSVTVSTNFLTNQPAVGNTPGGKDVPRKRMYPFKEVIEDSESSSDGSDHSGPPPTRVSRLGLNNPARAPPTKRVKTNHSSLPGLQLGFANAANAGREPQSGSLEMIINSIEQPDQVPAASTRKVPSSTRTQPSRGAKATTEKRKPDPLAARPTKTGRITKPAQKTTGTSRAVLPRPTAVAPTVAAPAQPANDFRTKASNTHYSVATEQQLNGEPRAQLRRYCAHIGLGGGKDKNQCVAIIYKHHHPNSSVQIPGPGPRPGREANKLKNRAARDQAAAPKHKFEDAFLGLTKQQLVSGTEATKNSLKTFCAEKKLVTRGCRSRANFADVVWRWAEGVRQEMEAESDGDGDVEMEDSEAESEGSALFGDWDGDKEL